MIDFDIWRTPTKMSSNRPKTTLNCFSSKVEPCGPSALCNKLMPSSKLVPHNILPSECRSSTDWGVRTHALHSTQSTTDSGDEDMIQTRLSWLKSKGARHLRCVMRSSEFASSSCRLTSSRIKIGIIDLVGKASICVQHAYLTWISGFVASMAPHGKTRARQTSSKSPTGLLLSVRQCDGSLGICRWVVCVLV